VPGPNVPFPPMEAQLVKELPETDGWQFEPKWDGFRGVLENDGDELALWSRNGRPLLRYFPELRPLGDLLPPRSGLDGEIVIARDGVLDFDSMQMRLHPAESRVRKLSAEIPADFIVFDLLLWDGKPIHEQPLEQRRAELERVADGFHLSPTTSDAKDAQKWLDSFEAAGLDGVIAKKLGLPYLPGSRDGVLKVKPHKTADCVIVGVRWKEKPTRIATLLLGLYNEEKKLDYVGSAAVAASKHKELAAEFLNAMSTPAMGKRWIETIYLQSAVDVDVKEFSGPYASYFTELMARQKGEDYFIGQPLDMVQGQCKDTFGQVLNSGFPGGLVPVDQTVKMMNTGCFKG